MKLTLRLHAFSFGLATSIVFSLWVLIGELGKLNGSLKIVLGGLVSLLIYRLIADGIMTLSRRFKFIKKLLLGPQYMEGTWVGFYTGVSGKMRFFIEHFEQELDSLTIKGASYNEKFLPHSAWNSVNVKINVEDGIIEYMYKCSPYNDKTDVYGVAVFDFKRKNKFKPPFELSGYSADNHFGVRTPSFELKISDNSYYNNDEALKKAKEFYKRKMAVKLTLAEEE